MITHDYIQIALTQILFFLPIRITIYEENYFNMGIIVPKDAVIHSLRDSVTDRSNSYEKYKLKCRKVSASCMEGHRAITHARRFIYELLGGPNDTRFHLRCHVPISASALSVCTVYEILMRLVQRYRPNDKFPISDFAFQYTTRT